MAPKRHGAILPFLQPSENRENPYTVSFVSKGTGSVWRGVGTRPQTVGRKRRKRRLLATTKTDEKAIAAPAKSGLSRPTAASGIIATL